jgi:hypothetical protein
MVVTSSTGPDRASTWPPTRGSSSVVTTAGGDRPDRAAPDGGPPAAEPTWPIAALLAGYPLWWALGFGDFVFIVAAAPVAWRMFRWRRSGARSIRVPPGFGLWLLFLVVSVAGIATISATAPGTISSPVASRLLSFSVRTASYLSVTALLLYAGNLTERELPRQRLAWLLGLVAIYTTVGGLAGVAVPGLSFSSPLLLMLPHHVQSNPYILAEMHPSLAQVQNVLGGSNGRPDAPFAYTNTWGNCLALLLPWLVAAWWARGTRRQRRIAAVVLALSVIPAIYSLNRGLWLGLIVAVCYLAFRLAARGNIALLATIFAGIAVVALVVLATPLQSLISQRLQNGHSDAHRAQLSVLATRDALASPIIGFGDTRHEVGSVTSIAVGRTENCHQCGQMSVGNNGQLWLLLICSGFVGAAFYLAFFGYGVWRFWRDRTPEGMAGVLVLVLTFVFMIAYDAVGAPLAFTMLTYAYLWRNERARQQAVRPGAGRWPGGWGTR